MNQIVRANNVLALRHRLFLTAAAIQDIQPRISNETRLKLGELEILLSSIIPNIMPEVLKLVYNFNNTFVRGTLNSDIWQSIDTKMPKLRKELLESGFCANYKSQMCEPKITEEANSSESKLYYSFGDIGFSFGSNIALLGWLHSLTLGVNKNRLVIYALPKEMSTFPELIEWCKAWESEIDIKPILSHHFDLKELTEINKYKSLSYRSESLTLLRSKLSIESYISDEQNLDKNCDSQTNLLELSSKIVHKKMGLPYQPHIESRIPFFSEFKGDRKLAILCNRDDEYLGGGQEWRNVSINRYIPVISDLINEGYSVIRFNTTGTTCNYSHKHFIDLTRNEFKATPALQFHLAALAEMVIGCNTGALGVAQVLSSKPCLCLDYPTFEIHSPWQKVLMSTKRLIANTSSSRIRAEDLCYRMWDSQFCSDNGFTLQTSSESELLLDLHEFLSCIKNNKWNEMPSLRRLPQLAECKFNALITTVTFEYFGSLFEAYSLSK